MASIVLKALSAQTENVDQRTPFLKARNELSKVTTNAIYVSLLQSINFLLEYWPYYLKNPNFLIFFEF